MRVLAIDPGNLFSGCVIIDSDEFLPVAFDKTENNKVLHLVGVAKVEEIVIEMIASYGMSVGQTVFDTCVFIGKIMERARVRGIEAKLVFRKDVKMNLCGKTKANDSNIKQALVDRFSYPRHAAKGGKGVRKDPGFFFGFKSDIWQAYALGVTWIDKYKIDQTDRIEYKLPIGE